MASLAEACAPFGGDVFRKYLHVIKDEIRGSRGKLLASFLRLAGSVFQLLTGPEALSFAASIISRVIQESSSHDELIKRTIISVVKKIVTTEGATAEFVKKEIVPSLMQNLWNRRNVLDRKLSRSLIETTLAFAGKVGSSTILKYLSNFLHDSLSVMRSMALEASSSILSLYGLEDVNDRLEEKLIDGYLFTLLESDEDTMILTKYFGVGLSAFGVRASRYLYQFSEILIDLMAHKSSRVRTSSAKVLSTVAQLFIQCDCGQDLKRLSMVFFECLSEEYPDVLAAVLHACLACLEVLGAEELRPEPAEFILKMSNILRNKQEDVQFAVASLISSIAQKAPDSASPKEWLRIVFELIENLSSSRKNVRKSAIAAIGSIAQAIGPSDVLLTLLNNLRVQERQNRLATTLAVAVVADTCGPFTVLPALFVEYKTPSLNIQNGVLKAISYICEYMAEKCRDYVYALVPLLQDALIDADLVHRQTACTAVRHLAYGVVGHSAEDALLHLLNYIWPNILEPSIPMIVSFIDAIEALRVGLGPGTLLLYTLQGLFFSARKVRERYCGVYNMLRIGSEDVLPAFYPTIVDDDRNGNIYSLPEHDLII
ncbi:hypothetical protein GEMRC1_007262 [Eukaryota sp. GEM-RC1]